MTSSISLLQRLNSLLYPTARWLTRHALLPCFTRLHVDGLDSLPLTGPVVIAANHLNDGDPVILTAVIPRRIVFMAKAELFDTPVFGTIARAFGAIPVRRNQADLSALRRAGDVLSRGLALVIFPEGRSTTSDARLAEAWPGAAIVALRSGAPVLPIAITGSQRLQWPSVLRRIFRREDVTVMIGAPFWLPAPERINAQSAAEGTRMIMQRIAALLPIEYRGYYGSEPLANDAAGERAGSHADHPGE